MKTAFYKSTFAGILYFPVTPFGNDGVNIALFRDLLSERLAAGPGAVFVACGTGEFTALSLGEYRQVVRAAMAKVSRTVPVFAGVGYPGRLAVEFAQVAEEEDVVGVLLMPTLFEKPTDESLLEHLRAILKCMKFPVILYQKGSVRLSPKLATILADEPNIIGIKDGTGDVDSLARVIRSAPDNWTFFNGTATAEISQLAYEAIGVHGYSSAVFAFHPEVAQKFYYAIRGGDQVAVADALKTFYDPFTEIRDRQPGYAVLLLKAGLRYSGHDVGGTRPPIQNPNPGDEADLFQLLASVSAGSHKNSWASIDLEFDGGIVMTDSPVMALANISKSYSGSPALRDVSLEIPRGSVVGLVGENGAGKSTLVNIISGAIKPDKGVIQVGDSQYSHLDPQLRKRLGVSVCHQEIRLAPNLTVAENLRFGSLPSRFGNVLQRACREQAKTLLEAVGARISPSARVKDLSVANQQMVEIARAVSLTRSVLILDEPTASLSPQDCELLFATVRRLRSEGMSVLYISHRLEEVQDLCDSVTVFRDGERVATLGRSEYTRDALVHLMVGRKLVDIYPRRSPSFGPDAITIDRLSGEGSEIPNSLRIRGGEIVGLFGLVGAGRSEFVRLIAGLSPITGGSIQIGEATLYSTSIWRSTRLGISYVSENRKEEGLHLEFSIADNFATPQLVDTRRRFSLGHAGVARMVTPYLAQLDVRPAQPDRIVATLSGGNQQKVAIGKWLVRKPKLLIVDEPTRGVDVGAKTQIYALLARLAEEGIAILMVSSDLAEVQGLSDRIIVFHSGATTGEAPGGTDADTLMKLALGDVVRQDVDNLEAVGGDFE